MSPPPTRTTMLLKVIEPSEMTVACDEKFSYPVQYTSAPCIPRSPRFPKSSAELHPALSRTSNHDMLEDRNDAWKLRFTAIIGIVLRCYYRLLTGCGTLKVQAHL
jgi:hypothetical protein